MDSLETNFKIKSLSIYICFCLIFIQSCSSENDDDASIKEKASIIVNAFKSFIKFSKQDLEEIIDEQIASESSTYIIPHRILKSTITRKNLRSRLYLEIETSHSLDKKQLEALLTQVSEEHITGFNVVKIVVWPAGLNYFKRILGIKIFTRDGKGWESEQIWDENKIYIPDCANNEVQVNNNCPSTDDFELIFKIENLIQQNKIPKYSGKNKIKNIIYKAAEKLNYDRILMMNTVERVDSYYTFPKPQ